MVNGNRTLLHRALSLAALAALFVAGCQRTLINLNTPSGLSAGSTDERTAVVQNIVGAVDTRPNSESPWTPASLGQVLAEGDGLRTGPASRALVQITEGSKIWLGPDTIIALSILNPFLDSLLTSLALEKGVVWVLLNGGALDVETPVGIASARSAYLSAAFDALAGTLDVTCLQGTCSFGSVFIAPGSKLLHAESNAATEAMTLADFGVWGMNVPEATQLAALATEAVAQGNATLPVVPTSAPTRPPATTAAPAASPRLTSTGAARPTSTPLPAVPILGIHIVRGGETLFCIARGYGVLPAAIARANGLTTPFTVVPGQTLKIPAVQWTDIIAGPVCAPQFKSPYPGLPVTTPTQPGPTATTAPAATGAPPTNPPPTPAPLTLTLHFQCLTGCDGGDTYVVRVSAEVSGGRTPYTFAPAQVQDLTFPHCADQSGTVMVTAADGQSLTSPWTHHDPSCPTP